MLKATYATTNPVTKNISSNNHGSQVRVWTSGAMSSCGRPRGKRGLGGLGFRVHRRGVRPLPRLNAEDGDASSEDMEQLENSLALCLLNIFGICGACL